MRIDDAGISAGIRSKLRENGFETLEQLSKQRYSKIMELKGIGPSAMDELERALATRGLKLRDRPKERSEFYQQIGVYP